MFRFELKAKILNKNVFLQEIKKAKHDDTPQIAPPKTVTASNIASRLLCVFKALILDKNHGRATKISICELKSTL
jgi:hypothetical protein